MNQLTSIGGSATAHDARGNLTSDPTSGKTYGYSSENLLTSASGGVTLAYDPQMRLYQVAGASTTRFAYDGLAMIAEYNAANALQRRFVHGPGMDEPLVQYEGAGTTDRRWLHADERGSVVATSDGGGNMLTINKYDEFGKPQGTNAGRFQYTGQMWLPELGLYHYKARAYAPHLGRFLQTDPIGYADGMNWYAYTGNDPVNFTDPSGRYVCIWDARGEACYEDEEDALRAFNRMNGDDEDTIVVTGRKKEEPACGSGTLVNTDLGSMCATLAPMQLAQNSVTIKLPPARPANPSGPAPPSEPAPPSDLETKPRICSVLPSSVTYSRVATAEGAAALGLPFPLDRILGAVAVKDGVMSEIVYQLCE